jgi:hypothetical protein
MSKDAKPCATEPFQPALFSALSAKDQAACLVKCREISNQIHPGLDLTQEILAVQQQKLGDTVLVRVARRLVAFAVCHFGKDTEGGPESCYVKFGGVRPGTGDAAHFDLLLEACEECACAKKLQRVVTGVSTARHEAYRQMMAAGYRADIQGLGMSLHNLEGYSRPGIYALDDWR